MRFFTSLKGKRTEVCASLMKTSDEMSQINTLKQGKKTACTLFIGRDIGRVCAITDNVIQ